MKLVKRKNVVLLQNVNLIGKLMMYYLEKVRLDKFIEQEI